VEIDLESCLTYCTATQPRLPPGVQTVFIFMHLVSSRVMLNEFLGTQANRTGHYASPSYVAGLPNQRPKMPTQRYGKMNSYGPMTRLEKGVGDEDAGDEVGFVARAPGLARVERPLPKDRRHTSAAFLGNPPLHQQRTMNGILAELLHRTYREIWRTLFRSTHP
jgi:hypothetical protein